MNINELTTSSDGSIFGDGKDDKGLFQVRGTYRDDNKVEFTKSYG